MRPIKGAVTRHPASLKTKFPIGTRRASIGDFAVVISARMPLPRFAPNTSPSATSGGITPEAARVAVNSTIARLEYASNVSAAPTVISSNTSLVSEPSINLTFADCINGCVAWTINCNASVMRPRPINTRPTWPTAVA